AGIASERAAGGVMVLTLQRPPLNLMDAAMACKGIELERAFLRDPDLVALIVRSGLPRFYHVRDAGGELLVDNKGKPRRIGASRMEADELPRGYARVGPIRTFG